MYVCINTYSYYVFIYLCRFSVYRTVDDINHVIPLFNLPLEIGLLLPTTGVRAFSVVEKIEEVLKKPCYRDARYMVNGNL